MTNTHDGTEPLPKQPSFWLLMGDNSMKGFQVPHKRAKGGKDFLLWRQCPEISSLVFSMLFPSQFYRNMAFSEILSQHTVVNLKKKSQTFPSSAEHFGSIHQAL